MPYHDASRCARESEYSGRSGDECSPAFCLQFHLRNWVVRNDLAICESNSCDKYGRKQMVYTACGNSWFTHQGSSKCIIHGKDRMAHRTPVNRHGLNQASNWVWNFFVVMITGPSFANIGWRTYIGQFSVIVVGHLTKGI